MMTTIKGTPVKTREKKVFVPTYIVTDCDDFEVFNGTLEQFRTSRYSQPDENKQEHQLLGWASAMGYKVQKRFKRGSRNVVCEVIYDPANPEKFEFGRYKHGKRKGKKANWMCYTDSMGRKYTFYIEIWNHCSDLVKEGIQSHKREIQNHLMTIIQRAVTGTVEEE